MSSQEGISDHGEASGFIGTYPSVQLIWSNLPGGIAFLCYVGNDEGEWLPICPAALHLTIMRKNAAELGRDAALSEGSGGAIVARPSRTGGRSRDSRRTSWNDAARRGPVED